MSSTHSPETQPSIHIGIIGNGVKRERELLNCIRIGSGAWEAILPQELLKKDSLWTQTNCYFVPTSIHGTLNLKVLKDMYTNSFDLIVSDLDGAVRSPYFRKILWRDRYPISSRSDHELLDLLHKTGECVFYSANTFSRKEEEHRAIQNFGKFFGQNKEVVLLILKALAENKKVLYYGSSDFDTLVVIQVLLELKAKLFKAKCNVAKAKRDSAISKGGIKNLDTDIKACVTTYNNLYFATTSRKFI